MRVCPHCGKQIRPTLVVAFSDGLECPHCHSSLRVSDASRFLGAWLALALGLLVWEATRGPSHGLAWLLPEIYAFLSFSVVYALYLMATANLVMRPAEAPAPPRSSGGGLDAAQH